MAWLNRSQKLDGVLGDLAGFPFNPEPTVDPYGFSKIRKRKVSAMGLHSFWAAPLLELREKFSEDVQEWPEAQRGGVCVSQSSASRRFSPEMLIIMRPWEGYFSVPLHFHLSNSVSRFSHV